jgi:hypothetical protein
MSLLISQPVKAQVLEADPLADPLQKAIALGWRPVCHITYNRDAWVKLINPPSQFSDDEALLLCQESPDTWVAWVPDYGEVVLRRNDFYS